MSTHSDQAQQKPHAEHALLQRAVVLLVYTCFDVLAIHLLIKCNRGFCRCLKQALAVHASQVPHSDCTILHFGMSHSMFVHSEGTSPLTYAAGQ